MNNVHLVFHGVFVIVLNPEGIEVLFPYSSSHEYLFGSWNSLQPLGKGELRLTGLQAIVGNRPNPDFSSDSVPMVKHLQERQTANLFSVLKIAGYPMAVHSFRPYTKPLNFGGAAIPRFPYGGIHGAGLNPTSLAGPMVLSYEAESIDNIQVVNRDKPIPFQRVLEPDGSTLNLHFFAEGEQDLPPDGSRDRLPQAAIHYQQLWNLVTSLIAGLDIRLDQVWPFVDGHTDPLPPDTGLPGLPKEQLADLDELHIKTLDPAAEPFGGDTDCEKAHLVVDNRA
jgi:hypothetical protein